MQHGFAIGRCGGWFSRGWQAALTLLAVAVVSGCAVRIDAVERWSPVPLDDAEFTPSAVLLQGRPRVAVLDVTSESAAAMGAGLPDVARASLEQLLGAAGLEITDAATTSALQATLRLNGTQAAMVPYAGPEVADFVIDLVVGSVLLNTRFIDAVEVAGRGGETLRIPASYRHEARVAMTVRIYQLPSLRLVSSMPVEGVSSLSNQEPQATPEQGQSLLRVATESALQQRRAEILAETAPRGYVLERRTRGTASIFRVALAKSTAARSEDRVEILSQRPDPDSTPRSPRIEQVLVAQGSVALTDAGAGSTWVLVSDEAQARAVRRGDVVRVKRGGAYFDGWKALDPPDIGLPATQPAAAHVAVLFGTNRGKTGRNEPGRYFGAEESEAPFERRLTLGRALVRVPPNRRPGELATPGSFWVALETLTSSPIASFAGLRPLRAADPDKHFSFARPLDELDDAAFAELLKKSVAASATKSALVYVHGYGNSFEDAAFRTAQFTYDLVDKGYDVVPVMFSWTADPGGIGYLAATDRIWSAGKQLAAFLRKLSATTGAGVIHIVGHSKGAQVLGIALDSLQSGDLQALAADGKTVVPRFRQIVLAAPDIRAADFQSLILPAVSSRHIVTNYVSSNDAALQASKQFNAGPRAGDSGNTAVLVRGVQTIDVTAVNLEAGGHSSFAESPRVIADIRDQLLGKQPEQRRLRRVDRLDLHYWLLRD